MSSASEAQPEPEPGPTRALRAASCKKAVKSYTGERVVPCQTSGTGAPFLSTSKQSAHDVISLPHNAATTQTASPTWPPLPPRRCGPSNSSRREWC